MQERIILKLFTITFIFIIVLGGEAFSGTMDSCENLSEKKLKKCLDEIIASSSWEPLKSNLSAALKKTNNKINIKFDPKIDRAAITKVEVKNQQYVPVIIMGKNTDALEMLITLNHEMVHYLSTFDRLALVFNNEKIGNCLTEYQLKTLKDESDAFMRELDFWKNAPEDFRKHFSKIYFQSKVFNKKLNYDEFYSLLEKNMAADKNFILKKYIDWGDYLPCAKNII